MLADLVVRVFEVDDRCVRLGDHGRYPVTKYTSSNVSVMAEPLSKSQQQLRGRKILVMSVEQLRDWIDACDKMEAWVDAAKARREWRLSGIEATEELERRKSKSNSTA